MYYLQFFFSTSPVVTSYNSFRTEKHFLINCLSHAPFLLLLFSIILQGKIPVLYSVAGLTGAYNTKVFEKNYAIQVTQVPQSIKHDQEREFERCLDDCSTIFSVTTESCPHVAVLTANLRNVNSQLKIQRRENQVLILTLVSRMSINSVSNKTVVI